MQIQKWGWTLVALCSFAANSLLCRLALRETAMGPVAFTLLRMLSGTIMLLCLTGWPLAASASGAGTLAAAGAGSWRAGLAMLVYMVGFSLAYVSLPAGTGALLLFGAVQLTMVGVAAASGVRPGRKGWLGIGLAMVGLFVLTWRGTGPLPAANLSPRAVALMVTAGAAWGVYSLLGKKVGTKAGPAMATSANFLRATALLLPLLLLAISMGWVNVADMRWPRAGVVYALLSGAVTSALGYIVWYRAMRLLDPIEAAVGQLCVPPLAVLGGVLLLGEALTSQLLLGGGLVLAGVAMVALRK